MSLFKCKMCGGDLEIAEGVTTTECEYCGTKQPVPKAMDENLQNLFNRANTLRIKSEFDKAEKLYERIIQADTTQPEAYWGLILCKYGIEYVDDPKTYKKVPTCHRASYESITADEDYKSAMQHADLSQRVLYEEQAKEIDRIQKEILALAQKEETYDVFICYKETDASGQRTQDSAIANDIYYQLTQEGFKVFYAAITLEGKLGSAYEPIIFAALNSSKVMLVIGTKPEYFNAVWVKNEWSRYLKIVSKDRSKLLIPCYRDMDAYELPEEFAHLQAQDMSKIGFINDVVRGIKKVAAKEEPKVETVVKETVVTAAPTNTAPLLKRAFMFLEDGDFAKADDFCEQVLNQDPENAQAYLGKLMAELKARMPSFLQYCDKPFDNKNNYQKAIRFGDESLQKELMGYIAAIKERNELSRLDSIYSSAKTAMATANTESAYKEAARRFETIREYQDSAALAQTCHEKAEVARKDAILAEGKAKMTGEVISNYEAALKLFASIPNWKDADEQTYACQKKIKELEAKAEADRLERERQAEIDRIEEERLAKRNKKIAIIATPIVCTIIAFTIVVNAVIIPNGKYNDAIALMNAGEYTEAYKALIALDGYKDSADKASSIYAKYKIEELKATQVGDYVVFGTYEQDNNTSNGKEDVEWLVLEVKTDKVLVISKYALDCKPYNASDTDVTCETCTLRKWLNNNFINSAFTADEKAMIPAVTVSADENPEHNTNPGKATQDRVFLLSLTEANQYFSSDSARQCKATDYAVANGAGKYQYYWNNDYQEWWLRSPGRGFGCNFVAVNDDGSFHETGYDVYSDSVAVRPAMWIDLNAIE